CLVIVTASNLSIVLYDLGESSSVRVITYDGGFGQSLYVFEDGTIYWVIYNPFTTSFIILCTSKEGVTRNLGIWYIGEICVVVDRLYIYVLDKDNNRIDIYSRRTLMKLWELHVIPNVNELILVLDIDECCSNNTCHMNATCSDTPGSFVCTCNEGFEPSGDDCLDINECDRGSCDPNADCVNSQGSFYCTCISGFVGNGLNCTETCEDEILFYSTSSEIISNSSVSIPTADNNILGYDKYNRRLLYYDDTENLYSVGLNGLNSTVLINKANIAEFAYDGERGVLYYLNSRTLKINSVNISSGEDAPVQALDSLSGIRGVEMDTKNRYLVIAKSSEPPIVRLDITSFETQRINFDGSAQALSFDQDNEVVYWVNFVVSTEKYNLTRSSYTGQTVALNISYDGEIDLAQDYMHLYVLDKENNRIDKYNKRTWVKINVFNINDGPQRLIVAFDYDECCVGTYCPEMLSTCSNTPSSFECMCIEGYFRNGTICQDIIDCDDESPCHVNATCNDIPGSYECNCPDGLTGNGTYCEDINECMVGGFCHDNATCDNTYGSYSCECYGGFTGDGKNCTGI
ncbi:extracellular matrix A-like isoform X2, partial [Paramuricea clavata]